MNTRNTAGAVGSGRRIFLRTCAAAAVVSAFAAPAIAQTAYPNKPIRLLVGFAPGGGTDIVARALGVKMSEILGQPIVVENRAGASGTIAAAEVARAAPDGYTLLMGHSNSNAIAPFVLDKVPYDAGSDFTPITYVGYVPNVLVIHPSIPARTVPELVALAKAKPGTYTYASSGVGSTQHLGGRTVRQPDRRAAESHSVQRQRPGRRRSDWRAGQHEFRHDAAGA